MKKAIESYIVNSEYIGKLAEIHQDPDFISVDILMAFALFLNKAASVDPELGKRYLQLARESLDEIEKTLN